MSFVLLDSSSSPSPAEGWESTQAQASRHKARDNSLFQSEKAQLEGSSDGSAGALKDVLKCVVLTSG